LKYPNSNNTAVFRISYPLEAATDPLARDFQGIAGQARNDKALERTFETAQ
jgi:hypothetical protein